MYSTNNEGKFVQLKYTVHLIYHSTIKMKHVNVKSSTYADSSKEINDKDPKSKIWDTVNILKSKNISAKGSTPNWSEQILLWKKSEILRRENLSVMILTGTKLLEL